MYAAKWSRCLYSAGDGGGAALIAKTLTENELVDMEW
jgi:hypothetical protein